MIHRISSRSVLDCLVFCGLDNFLSFQVAVRELKIALKGNTLYLVMKGRMEI